MRIPIPTSAEDESISRARLALLEANQAMTDFVLSPWDRLRLIIDSGKTNLAVVRTVDILRLPNSSLGMVAHLSKTSHSS